MPYSAVQTEWLRALDHLERALDQPDRPMRSSEGLMKQWGAMLVETSQRSFVEQRLGEWKWPARYEGQEPPIINIAGALEDFNAGRTAPKPNRFQDRPALVDLGMAGGMWGSVSFSVQGPREVAAGSNKPYAEKHMKGGQETIRISEDAYQRGRDWLFDKQGNPRKGREGYVKHLWPPLFRRFHRQTIRQRPFVGVTPQLAQDMMRATEEYFHREQGLGGGRITAAV